MNTLSEKRRGERDVFVGSLMWGLFPVTVVLSYAMLPSLVSLGCSTILAAAFFAGVMTYRKRWPELKDARVWESAGMIALSIGVLFYGFYFYNLIFCNINSRIKHIQQEETGRRIRS